jgi:hypothetical protein
MSTKGAQCLSQPPVGDLSADSVRPANSHQPVKRSKIASPIHLSQPAAVLGETTGDEGRSPSIEVGLPRERHVERLEPLGGLPQQTRRPLPDVAARLISPRSCSTRARWRSSTASACRWACTAARARSARSLGSAVSDADRCKNAAAVASPARAWARCADRSSSAATSSSGPEAAAARCHTRRSGSLRASVESAGAGVSWPRRRGGTPVLCVIASVQSTAGR